MAIPPPFPPETKQKGPNNKIIVFDSCNFEFCFAEMFGDQSIVAVFTLEQESIPVGCVPTALEHG